MQFVSTRGRAPATSFREALFAGLAPDAGLYVPASLPVLDIEELRGAPLAIVGQRMASALIGDEIAPDALARLLADALDFPIPAVQFDRGLWALELFRGPTLAFKDVGARVMARLMAHFNSDAHPFTVLVATSGDTGGAVAHAFHGVAGTRVVVLFPEGQVSPIQEAQFTTLGGNVTAIGVSGTFDDCQRLVKQAFADHDLHTRARLTSANSINIGRLLPQMFYYMHAALYVDRERPSVFSVPSGNFGNLTAGVMARMMGAPIAEFIAATTINDAGPRYLATGRYEPQASQTTLANSMDVGDPSNLERLRWLFHDDHAMLRGIVVPSVHTDDDVRAGIAELFADFKYTCDPHSAIAYMAARGVTRSPTVFLATAHPAKFRDVVEPIIQRRLALPPALQDALARPRQVERIGPRFDELKDSLRS